MHPHSSGVHIGQRSDDLIKEPLLVLSLQQQVRKGADIPLGITKSFHGEDIVTNPVQVDPDQSFRVVKKDAIVEFHRTGTHAEEQRERLLPM